MPSPIAFAGSVPANYDKYLGPFLFEPYAKDLVQRLTKGLHKVLEIACGTGRVTKHLVATLASDGQLTATDLNPDMVSVAQQEVPDTKVIWSVADAQQLPFEDETFDAVVCQFGVMFFPDKAKAFTETHRVLKMGGKFLFNTWDAVDANPPIAILDKVLKEVFGEAAPDFLRAAPYSLYDKKLIKSLLQQALFKNIKMEVVTMNSGYSTPDDIIKGFLEGTPLFTYLAEKDAAQRNIIQQNIKKQLTEQFGESSSNVPLQAIVCEVEK